MVDMGNDRNIAEFHGFSLGVSARNASARSVIYGALIQVFSRLRKSFSATGAGGISA